MSIRGLARHDREVGQVVSVTGVRVVVEIHEDLMGSVHAYPGGQSTIAQIGAYVAFPIGAGDSALGIIVGAHQHEGYEPDNHSGMTLQLAKPRRTMHANLLGTLCGDTAFRPGVAVYPTLGTPALTPSSRQLKAVLEGAATTEEGMPLCLGSSSIYEHVHVSASLDDLFSRPLAVVGNTGSGKSWTVATAIQRTQRLLAKRGDYSPRFVILDLNGEYDRAFGIKAGHREPNSVYVNGQPFTLPLWTLNFEEFCRFFGASAATQAPVLERIVTFAREDAYDAGQPRAAGEDPRHVRQELRKIERAQQFLRTLVGQARTTDGPYVGTKARAAFAGLRSLLRFADGTEKLWIALDRASMQSVRGTIADIDGTDLVHYTDSKQPKQGEVKDPYDALPAEETDLIERLFEELDPLLTTLYDSLTVAGGLPTMTADTPYPFAPSRLNEGDLFDLALSGMRGEERIREYIATLRLRVRRLLQDRRWSVFWQGSWDLTLTELMEPILNSEIAVVDCSMLAQEVLPFVCAVIGRLLLDIRQHGSAAERTRTPWVLVLEEAHNCIRPRREGEHEGLALSRSTFERIAKEGRKFGLSLAIASQRPSDISDTALSQCANFIVHRIQNPNDIDYFRRTLPGGSRETLDQVSVLTPGEALLMGSAVNVPCRVRMWAPSPTPLSDTPKPTVGWLTSNPAFDAAAAIGRWAAVGNPPDSQTES